MCLPVIFWGDKTPITNKIVIFFVDIIVTVVFSFVPKLQVLHLKFHKFSRVATLPNRHASPAGRSYPLLIGVGAGRDRGSIPSPLLLNPGYNSLLFRITCV